MKEKSDMHPKMFLGRSFIKPILWGMCSYGAVLSSDLNQAVEGFSNIRIAIAAVRCLLGLEECDITIFDHEPLECVHDPPLHRDRLHHASVHILSVALLVTHSHSWDVSVSE